MVETCTKDKIKDRSAMEAILPAVIPEYFQTLGSKDKGEARLGQPQVQASGLRSCAMGKGIAAPTGV